MMRKLLTVLLLFITLKAVAKRDYNWRNGEEDWRRLKQVQALTIPVSQIDTAIVVVSNRLLQKDSLRFMCEDIQADQLHYFFVYVHNGTWYVLTASSLSDAMQHLPGKNDDWLIYTEGMGKVFPANLDRGIRVSAFYNVNVVLLDYPSIHPAKASLGNYNFAKRNARSAYKYFTPVVDTLKILRDNKLMGTGALSFFFHSMGNNVIKQLVKNDKLKTTNNDIWVDNLILNAPCVNQRKHRKWIEGIEFAKRIYIHYNPKDKTLYYAQLASFHKQLGKKVKRPLAKNAIYINFNKVAGEGHSNFLPFRYRTNGAPEAFRHYKVLFHGGTVAPGDSRDYAPSAYKGIGWDMLPAVAK